MMGSTKYLLSLLFGTLVYVLISVLCGQNGVWAKKQLEAQKQLISARTREIQNINEELKLEKTAIRDDIDVIAAYARKLDYVFEGEKLVKIKGLVVSTPKMYETGTVLKSVPVAYVEESFCKGAAAVVGILSFVMMALFDVSYGEKRISQKKRFDATPSLKIDTSEFSEQSAIAPFAAYDFA